MDAMGFGMGLCCLQLTFQVELLSSFMYNVHLKRTFLLIIMIMFRRTACPRLVSSTTNLPPSVRSCSLSPHRPLLRGDILWIGIVGHSPHHHHHHHHHNHHAVHHHARSHRFAPRWEGVPCGSGLKVQIVCPFWSKMKAILSPQKHFEPKIFPGVRFQKGGWWCTP